MFEMPSAKKLRRCCPFYTVILVIAALFASQNKVGQLPQWSYQSSNETRRQTFDSNITNAPNQVDVLVKIYGQLGNHLHMIGVASIFGKIAKELDPQVEVNVHYTPKGETKRLVETKNDIKACFPNFQDVDFNEIDESSRKEIDKNQRKYGSKTTLMFMGDSVNSIDEISSQKINFITRKEFLSFGSAERAPYLLSSFFTPAYLVDKYYDDLLKLFDFNDKECCNEVPDPDETVVHIRGYFDEIGKGEREIKQGRQELGPHQMANDMLGHLTEGDKVALVAPSTKISRPYKLALEKKGINVRSVSQSRVQDFCFLMKTTKELIAHHQTTFAYWAGVLSKSVKKVSLYHVKSPLYTKGVWHWHYHNWEHPKLRDVFQYPEFE